MSDHPDPLIETIRRALDQRSRELPLDTRRRLEKARREALAAYPRPRGRLGWRATLATTAAVLLAVVLFRLHPPSPPSLALDEAPPLVEDLPLLAESEDLQFYEDLDLLLWLETTHPAPEEEGDDPVVPGPAELPAPGGHPRGRV